MKTRECYEKHTNCNGNTCTMRTARGSRSFHPIAYKGATIHITMYFGMATVRPEDFRVSLPGGEVKQCKTLLGAKRFITKTLK